MGEAVYAIHQRLEGVAAVDDSVVLDHLQREKSRLRVRSAAGAELHIILPRGRALQVGDILRSDCGRHFAVVAAQETVLRACGLPLDT